MNVRHALWPGWRRCSDGSNGNSSSPQPFYRPLQREHRLACKYQWRKLIWAGGYPTLRCRFSGGSRVVWPGDWALMPQLAIPQFWGIFYESFNWLSLYLRWGYAWRCCRQSIPQMLVFDCFGANEPARSPCWGVRFLAKRKNLGMISIASH